MKRRTVQMKNLDKQKKLTKEKLDGSTYLFFIISQVQTPKQDMEAKIGKNLIQSK